jgi:hypothetical protein
MDDELEKADENLFESLNQHLSFLTDKFKVYDSLNQDRKNESHDDQELKSYIFLNQNKTPT